MKRLFALLLAAVMMLSLVGCDLFDYAGKLTGTWCSRVLESDEQKEAVMDQIDFYDEEKALVDSPLYTAKIVTFDEDGNYSFNEDPEGVKRYVRDFFEDAFRDLYEGRASLESRYELDFSQLSEEEFYQFYAELYSYTSFEEMLDSFAELIYDYDSFESNDHGTFTATSKFIAFDATDDEQDGNVSYELDGDTLTITYSDVVEIYTKMN